MNAYKVKHGMVPLLAAAAGLAATAAQAQQVDTSEWVCEYCPFETGQRTDVTVGATSVGEDSAYFGDATGYDESGVYANVDGNGSYTGEKQQIKWQAEDLGLDSRAFELTGGQPGKYDYVLSYRQLPRHRFDTTESIFVGLGKYALALPDSWVRAPSTAGFTALDASLAPQNIESERRIYEIGARYLPTSRFVFSLNFRQHQYDGNRIFGGSYFTQSSLLPGRFDYTTDLVDAGVGYAFNRGYLSLDFHLSEFDSAGNYLQFESPFTTAAGAETALLSRPPANSFQQVSLSGNYRFDAYDTVLSYSAATGRIEQDGEFLGYTSNPNIDAGALPLSNLGAEVDTTNFALSLTSRPFDKARVRFSYRFDERDNGAPQETWSRVIADTFLSTETVTNIPYSFERTALKVSGDYDLFDDWRLSAGYEYRTIDRDFQEVAEQTEDTGWGRLRWQPNGLIEISAKGGTSRRDVDRYDETYAGSLDQNPLMRKYNLAYRYRWFGELKVAASLPETPIGITFTSLYADDSYSESLLGLTDGTDLRLAADLGWTISENAMLYVNVGWEDIESNQAGSEQFATPDWTAAINDQFVTTAFGFRMNNIAEKFDLRFDYTMSDGETEIGLDSIANGTSAFPSLESDLDYLRLRLDWRYSDRLEFNANVRYQQFSTEDWALDGVAPDTMPTVLSLGAAPYDEDSWFFGIGVRYLMGGHSQAATPPAAEE